MKTRVALATFLLLLAASILVVGCSQEDKQGQLTVVSFGGAYQKAQKVAFMDPFAKETEATVLEGEYNGDYGLLHERATSAQGTWDVVSVESGPSLRGANEGIFLEIPESVFEGARVLPAARRKHSVGHLVFSTILAFSPKLVGDQSPTGWADFWDLNRFPGKRALRNNPRGSLEIALLADGVEPKKLYPLDVDRAINKLDAIKKNLVFWESGAQPVQLLANEVVSMTSVYNGRIWDARVNEGIQVDWVMNGGLMELEFWAIPKNAPHPKRALAYVKSTLRAERQAKFASTIAYGPTNLDASKSISAEILAALPTAPATLPSQVAVDAEWWAANEAKVSARWERWVGK